MTQEAHTPEPWEWRDDQMATPDNPIRQWTISPGVLIAETNNGTPGGDAIDRANARRIVACVNALAGIPIEAIESGVVAELKEYVVAFCGPWAVQYSRDFGLPEGHLHPTHYDILEKCGARMDDFTRAKLEASI